ncbi:MAG: RNA polymerase sigma-70 factor [Spirosomataceae bacterium]
MPFQKYIKTENTEQPEVFIHHDATEEAKVISDEYFIQNLFEQSPQKGFDMLFRKYYANLCNNAIRFVYSKEIAEDIVAEIFTNFWQNEAYKNINTSYRAYLYKSVRYRAYNYIKAELNRTSDLESIETESNFLENEVVLKPDEILHYHELSRKLDLVIQNLPNQSKKAFQMHRLEGKKYSEVATELQITVSAVERLISRALSKIREELKSDWISIGVIILTFTN